MLTNKLKTLSTNNTFKDFYKSFKTLFPQIELRRLKTVRFSVGQPMGIYSSWASMAISHHILVYMAYYLCLLDIIGGLHTNTRTYIIVTKLLTRFSKYGYSNYSILGDDIVIFDEFVARKYLFLLKQVGIGVSIEKCFISSSVCEFAKRYITLTGVIYPMSCNIIFNTLDNRVLARSTARHRGIQELSRILKS